MTDYVPGGMTPRAALDTRSAFRQQVVESVVGAALDGRRAWIWVDADFAEWPLDDVHLLAAMTRWARRPDRTFMMLARDFSGVPRRHPRFTQWRRTWSHRIECRSAPDVSEQEMPTLLMAGELYSLQLLNKQRWQGRWLDDDAEFKSWREVVDAIVERSELDFPADNLGL